MFKKLLAVVFLFSVSACSGGGGSDDNGGNSSGNSGGGNTTVTVTGTAATGIAIDGVVNVYGSNGGNILNVPVDASGNYSVDVTGLAAPFFICAVPDDPNLASQYSFANGPGVANITPMTTLALFYANGNQNPGSLINTWPTNQASVTGNLPDAQAAVNANFVGVFATINSSLNIDFSTYDFFSTSFNIGDNFDQILDLLGVDLSSGTPAITVNGNTFTLDPNIDISGINIGGMGGGSGGLGSLTITGADTSVIGTNFSPTIQTGEAGTTTALVWGGVDGAQISVGASGSQLVTITLNAAQVIGGQVILYSYALNCLMPGVDCSKLQLDIANKQASFNNLVLPLSGAANNAATGPVILNGILNWQDNSTTPIINSFSASASTITAGESVNLTAVFTNGTAVIDNGVGSVTSSSPVSVSPSVTTTYTLTASNGSGNITSSATVIVLDSGGPMDLGSVTISGADTPVLGTSFTPESVQPLLTDFGFVNWVSGNTTLENACCLYGLAVDINDGQLSSVSFALQITMPETPLISEFYTYFIDCSGLVTGSIAADCSKITFDTNAKQLILSNVEFMTRLIPGSNNSGTGPVTLNGTVKWK